MVGKLHVVSIVVLHEVLNVQGVIVDGAVLVREHANLDAASGGGT